MLIELPIAPTIALNVAGCLALQLGCAWVFTRLPAAWFSPPRPWAWERRGKVYERWFAVRAWKDLLPDGATWFAGGVSKARLGGQGPEHLRAFARETSRGELCHWCAIAGMPILFLWNPWWADLILVVYALAANLPCVVAQRYNRARISRRWERCP